MKALVLTKDVQGCLRESGPSRRRPQGALHLHTPLEPPSYKKAGAQHSMESAEKRPLVFAVGVPGIQALRLWSFMTRLGAFLQHAVTG